MGTLGLVQDTTGLDDGGTPGAGTGRWRRPVTALILVVALGGASCLGACQGSSVTPSGPLVAAPTSAPLPEATPSPAPTAADCAPPSAGAPAPSLPPRLAAQIDAVVATVPDLRGLQPKRPVPYREISRSAFQEEFQQAFSEQNPASRLEAEQALDERLGLLPPGADLRGLTLALYGSQVLAYYDPAAKAFTLVGCTDGLTPADRITVAHEYDHALQDQYWGLQRLRLDAATTTDRDLAVTALIEGDATVLMLQWAEANLSPGDLLSVGSSVTPQDQAALETAPLLLRQEALFPYLAGLQYVLALQTQGGGGWDAVNTAWDAPPTTTEQIMHPDKYLAGEGAVPVALPHLASRLGAGWTVSLTDTLGELATGVWLARGQAGNGGLLGLTASLPNADAAAGWAGDRIASLDGPDGTWAVVWQTAWDSAADATEFATAAGPAVGDVASAHALLPVSVAGSISDPELILLASDPQVLAQLEGALDVGG
jgi:hypothetical protein